MGGSEAWVGKYVLIWDVSDLHATMKVLYSEMATMRQCPFIDTFVVTTLTLAAKFHQMACNFLWIWTSTSIHLET